MSTYSLIFWALLFGLFFVCFIYKASSGGFKGTFNIYNILFYLIVAAVCVIIVKYTNWIFPGHSFEWPRLNLWR